MGIRALIYEFGGTESQSLTEMEEKDSGQGVALAKSLGQEGAGFVQAAGDVRVAECRREGGRMGAWGVGQVWTAQAVWTPEG